MKTQFVLYFIFAFLIFACKKDKIINNGSSTTQHICAEQLILNGEEFNWEIKSDSIPMCYEEDMLFPNQIFIDGYLLEELTICPIPNSNKFAYLKTENTLTDNRDLYVYDMCTGTSLKIADNVAYSIDWGSNDWIIYTGVDFQLYKIKPNGSELTQLTQSEYANINVKWSPNGTRCFYDYVDSKILSDESGEFINSFEIYMFTWDWLNNEEIIYSSGSELKILNINEESIEEIGVVTDTPIHYIKVFNENEIYIRTNEGLYLLSYLTNLQLIEHSYSSYYSGFIDNLSDDYMIVNRNYHNFDGFDDCEYHLHFRLTVYEKNTGKEWLINIE